MDREEIIKTLIRRIQRLDPDQVEKLARYLDRLQDRPENLIPAAAQDQTENKDD